MMVLVYGVRQMAQAALAGDSAVFFFVTRRAEMDALPIDAYLRIPTSRSLVPSHPPETGGRVLLTGLILSVRVIRQDPQVSPAVIKPISVDMVDYAPVSPSQTEQRSMHLHVADLGRWGRSPIGVALGSQAPSPLAYDLGISRVDQGVCSHAAISGVERDQNGLPILTDDARMGASVCATGVPMPVPSRLPLDPTTRASSEWRNRRWQAAFTLAQGGIIGTHQILQRSGVTPRVVASGAGVSRANYTRWGEVTMVATVTLDEEVRGDTVIYDLAVTRPGVVAGWMTGGTLKFMAKLKPTDPDSAAIFTKSTPSSGIIWVDQSAVIATAVLTIEASDYALLPPGKAKTLHYEVEGTESNGRVDTLQRGELPILADVIRGA